MSLFIKTADGIFPVGGGSYMTVTPWVEVTSLLNSWTAVGGANPYQRVAYRKFGDMVQLRGRVEGGAAGTAIFNLPTGFRPENEYGMYPAASYDGTGNDAGTAMIAIGMAAGNVTAYYDAGDTQISLNGVQFSQTSTGNYPAYTDLANLGATPWTPTVTQSNTLTITSNQSRYTVLGDWVIGRFQFTVNSTGTANQPLQITMPVAPDVLAGAVGQGTIYDASTFFYYPGVIDMASGNKFVLSDTTQAGAAWWLGTVTFTAALAVNDSISGHFMYRRAV